MYKIVAAKFQSGPNDFSGKTYHYYTSVDLSVGDVIYVPAGKGRSIARITEVDLDESVVLDSVKPFLRIIESKEFPIRYE